MSKHTYKVNVGFIIDKIDGNIVIFDGERSILHTLNETSFFIFNLIKKGKNTGQIIEQLINSYSIDRTTAQKDVEDVVKMLTKQKIISIDTG